MELAWLLSLRSECAAHAATEAGANGLIRTRSSASCRPGQDANFDTPLLFAALHAFTFTNLI